MTNDVGYVDCNSDVILELVNHNLLEISKLPKESIKYWLTTCTDLSNVGKLRDDLSLWDSESSLTSLIVYYTTDNNLYSLHATVKSNENEPEVTRPIEYDVKTGKYKPSNKVLEWRWDSSDYTGSDIPFAKIQLSI